MIHAVGGGGAGGSAGAISTASYKTQTIEQIFDIRPDAKSADGEISAVDGTVLNDYIHTFPNEMFKKTTELGTITQAPKYENMKPWFTFDKLQEKYKFVFGVACGGKGGYGGDAVIKTNKDPECWKDWNKGCVMSQAPNQQSSSCCASSHSENFPTPHSVCDSYSKKWTTTCYYSLRQCCSALYNGNNESCVPNDKITTTGICNNQQGSCEENINKDGCVWKGETYTVTTPGGEGGDKPPCVYTATPLNNFAYIYKVKVSDYTGNDPTPAKAKTTTATLE